MPNNESNPIGALQEMCMADKRMGMPKYDDLEKIGPDHAPIFTVKVILNGNQAIGKATTKQNAKSAAARKMLQILKGIEPNQTAEGK